MRVTVNHAVIPCTDADACDAEAKNCICNIAAASFCIKNNRERREKMDLDVYMTGIIQSINLDINAYIGKILKIYGIYVSRQISRQIGELEGQGTPDQKERIQFIIADAMRLLPNISAAALADKQGNLVPDAGRGSCGLAGKPAECRELIDICRMQGAPACVVREHKPYRAQICEPISPGWYIILELTADFTWQGDK